MSTAEIALAVTLIKTLHDLSAALVRSSQGSKFAAEASEIQAKIIALNFEFLKIEKAIIEHQNAASQALVRLTVLESDILSFKQAALGDAKRIKELSEEVHKFRMNERKYTVEWGCLKFEDRDGLFCPNCYFSNERIIPAVRMQHGGYKCTKCPYTIK